MNSLREGDLGRKESERIPMEDTIGITPSSLKTLSSRGGEL